MRVPGRLTATSLVAALLLQGVATAAASGIRTTSRAGQFRNATPTVTPLALSAESIDAATSLVAAREPARRRARALPRRRTPPHPRAATMPPPAHHARSHLACEASADDPAPS